MRTLEHQEAAALMLWWTFEARRRKVDERLLFAIPNGGLRHKAVAMKLKAEGVRAGVLDYLLAIPTNDACGLWLELKAAKGRVSPAQEEMIILLGQQGYACGVVYGWQQAEKAIKDYLGWT